MEKKPELTIIGYASGIGANNPGCGLGPALVQTSAYLQGIPLHLKWQEMLYPHENTRGLQAIPAITKMCGGLAKMTQQLTQNHQAFVVMGGDHSCAIGSWSGTAMGIAPQGKLGLIWIDAHLDSHTPDSTISGNVHGMPLAALLGYGDLSLTQLLSPQPKIAPENVCIIGVRSFEPPEKKLLENLKVRIYYMDEVKERGLKTIFNEALLHVKKNTAAYGISLDLDAIDPNEAPGVGTPEPGGIHAQDLMDALRQVLQDPNFLGAEIVEFNPENDVNHKTEKIIGDLIYALFAN